MGKTAQNRPFKIGVVCVSSRFDPARAEAIKGWFAEHVSEREVALTFHPACFMKHGHFAGDDRIRAQAFIEYANDPHFDAIWFARGGYGSCRIAEAVLPHLNEVARGKRYLGYSDVGTLFGALYKAGFEHLAHGPMASDAVRRDETAQGCLDWLVHGGTSWLEPSLKSETRKVAAFNLTIIDQLVGTSLEPDLTDHVLMLEEVGEALYRIDRIMFHLTSQASIRKVAGIRLGRISDITYNEPNFGLTPDEIVRYWCARSGIPFLGKADIGHDPDNKIVPYG